MDVLEAIKTRRSIRNYRDEPIPEKSIEAILEAGRWAPSADNSQPWKFILVRDSEVKEKLAECFIYGRFIANTPLTIAVTINPNVSSHPVEDGAAATQNMLLAAHALGLGACWIGSYGSIYEEKAKDILGVPKGERLLSVVTVGYPAEAPAWRSRKALNEITFSDKYGKR